jgi:hypothetical protein
MEPVGGPVIEEDTSRRWLVRMLLVAMGVAVVAAGVVLLGGDDDGGGGDVAADRVGEAVVDEPGDDEASESPSGTVPVDGETAATTVPATAPVGEPDLLFGDSSQAFGAFGTIYDGNPVPVLEMVLYPDWGYVEVGVPDQPTYVDEYQWRGGDGVSGPEPATAVTVDEDELPEHLFDLGEIDPSKLPGMSEQGLAQFPQEGMEVTHVIINRFLPFDTRVLVRVYVSHPDRGGGGYVSFTPDGGLVETVS